jgi:predicted MPP superfamily phosphohydrolase
MPNGHLLGNYMPEPSLLTVLHISDFHFSKRKLREQGIVVDALIDDLKTLCIGHRKPDLVLFTGDLVHAAGADSHDEAYDFVIDRISKATGCSDERIFIVPGNHDVAWAGLEKYADEHRTWRSALGTTDEMSRLNELHAAGAFDTAVARKFANYLDLEDYLRGDQRKGARRLHTAFATVDHVEALNLDLVSFNTAVLSTGGHKSFDKDERNLAVPEYAVIEATKAVSPGSFRIFMTHHPLGMLSEQTARYLEGEITKHAHIHLFGHMHDPQPRKIAGLKGEVLSDQSGALFTARKEYYNGYSLITVDRSNNFAETLVRSYFKDRNEFDDGIDVIEGGRWWSSQEARQHFRKIASPVDEAKFRTHLSGPALTALRKRESTAGGDCEIHDRFVAPPMRQTFLQEAISVEGQAEIEVPVAFRDIIAGDTNLILYARAEYGRTTMLRELRYQFLVAAADVRFPRLPIMIDFTDIASNADNMLRKIRGGAEATPEDNDVESLLKLGHATVLIDDVQFADTRRMKVLREFVARFPKARYLLSSPYSSATKMGACIDPEMPVRFDFVEVREFRRNDMRQLLARDERCTDVEGWLDRLQNEFREINLPFTAANGSILIEILSEKHNFTPINRSVLMEQFVDSTLRKTAIEQSRRETFDYTNKTDLLSQIAAWMARNDEYVLAKEAVRTEMKAYIDSRGLNVDLDKLLDEFLAARIFIARSDGRISFRYRGVLEYFIALRMTVDPHFKDWILEETRYLRYLNEIQYYAGKLRNDAALVDLIGERHGRIMAEALADVSGIDLNQLDSISLPRDTDDLAAVAYEVASPPLSQQEKDEELEADFPTDAEDRQEVFRPKIEELSDRVTLSLILYSGMIKNMELITDADKRRHLSSIWYGWAVMLVTALRFAPRLAKERRIRINGALYEVRAPQGMSNTTLLRQMMLRLPHIHVRMLSNILGTEKLERQLTEPTLAEGDEPKIYDFLRTGLIADLRMAATPGAIDALATKLRDNHYLLWSLVVHVNELRRLGRMKEEHFRALEKPLAGAIANLKGGSHKTRVEEKRKQMARLARDRLMLTMKQNREK